MLTTNIVGRDDSTEANNSKEAGFILNLVQKDRVLTAVCPCLHVQFYAEPILCFSEISEPSNRFNSMHCSLLSAVFCSCRDNFQLNGKNPKP
jgi:hypothetical protein